MHAFISSNAELLYFKVTTVTIAKNNCTDTLFSKTPLQKLSTHFLIFDFICQVLKLQI